MNAEIKCNPLFPYYLALIEKYRTSRYTHGVMSDYLYINPRTDVKALTDDSKVSFIPMTNVEEKSNKVVYDESKYSDVKTGFTLFKRGDLLWAKITPCMQNGKSCTTDDMPHEIGFASTEFHVIRPKNHDVYMPYIWSIFSNDSVLKAAQGVFGGSAGQQRVPASFIETFPAIIPSFEQQKKLVAEIESAAICRVAALREADELLANVDSVVCKELGLSINSHDKQSVFATFTKHALNSRFDPEFHNPCYTSRIDSIRKMPHDTLENIVEFSNESWNGKSFFNETFPYIEISGVSLKTGNYKITETAVSAAPSRAKMVVRGGDIIVSTTRPHRGAVATVNDFAIASTGFCVLRNLKRNDLSKEYLQWILLNEYVLQQFLQRSSGGNYPAITQDEIKKVVVPIPSADVQAKIIKEVHYRQAQAFALKQKTAEEWAKARARFEKELLEG